MNTKKIKDADIAGLRIASLPSRPTAPTSFGGRGYTASEMKEAFDKLPLYIIERLNSLLDDIGGIGEGSLAGEIPTGIKEGHTLSALLADITTGEIGNYLSVLGEPLNECIMSLKEVAESHPEDIEALRLATDAAVSRLTAAEDGITEINDKLAIALPNMEQLTDELTVAVADILVLDADIAAAKDALNKLLTRMDSAEDGISENVSSIDAICARLEGDIAENRKDLDTAGGEIAAHSTRLEALEGEMAESKESTTYMNDRLDDLEGTAAAYSTRFETLESGAEAQDTRLEALEDTVASLDTSERIVKPDTEYEHTVALERGMDMRLGYTEMATITFPSPIPEDFYATLSFYAGDAAIPCLIWESSWQIYFSGDHVNEGEFYPDTLYHYTLFFWFTDSLHCNVRAVRYE